MNLEFFISRLGENANAIESLISGVDDPQARWKSAPEKWSLLQVVYHLLQIERKDFRPRLEKTLRDAAEEWQSISPEDTRLQNEENEDLPKLLQDFLAERRRSIEWLKTIENPNWENTHNHQHLSLAAGDLLASWLAHDFLHLKQITRIYYDYINATSQPFETKYAGDWT